LTGTFISAASEEIEKCLKCNKTFSLPLTLTKNKLECFCLSSA